ncbi:MAG: hypothetical protein CVU16_08295 [Betaproteobacteria bacterium HGW-Betaproteobacteria-10]|nr:MAG: hypothetical protein CVU16_08295 [Betaproteobacteria bacterium HGW-Betaproteobacteria-10]
MWRWLGALFLILPSLAVADAIVPICYGYGCLVQDDIHYSDARLGEIRRQLNAAVDAKNERKILADVIGQLYAWAGEQSAIRNDRGGNYADGVGSGKMDCIDHSVSTTRLLELLVWRGDLRWHRVLAVDVRYWALLFPAHYSAVIEEIGAGEAGRFVVDSWFVDNGQPAVILPLAEWKKGAGPDV